MANELNITSMSCKSTALNGQGGQGAVKPSASGNANPGGTKPPKPAEKSTPWATGKR